MTKAAGTAPTPFAAVILAGGQGSRLGGCDKAAVEVGGAPLLERVRAALAEADELVVVGPARPGATWTQVQEEPAGAGPMAALVAGMQALTSPADLVVAVAVDMPHLNRRSVQRLLAAASGDGAVLRTPQGRRVLALALRRSALSALIATADTNFAGASVWRSLAALQLTEVPAQEHEHEDIDTASDLAQARAMATPIP